MLKFSKLVLGLSFALFLSACSSTNNPLLNGNLGGGGQQQVGIGGFTKGSIEEFQKGIGNTVYFETDSSALTDQARQILTQQAIWLKQNQNYRMIELEGHADERGTREYNIALGARRASTVKDFLVASGIPANRITTVSYGKERPVAVCENISCWSQNRRSATNLIN